MSDGADRYHRNNEQRLEDHYGPLKRIGDGDQGTVFALLRQPGRVLKISHVAADADLAQYLWRYTSRGTKHLPVFYEALYDEGGWYLTVREDLADVGGWYGEVGTVTGMMENLLEDALDNKWARHGVIDGLQKTIKHYGRRIDADRPRAWAIIRAMEALMLWGFDNGFRIADIHADNLGQRADGTVVLRDLGFVKNWTFTQSLGPATDYLDWLP